MSVIAVIGGGPGGLMAAEILSAAKHEVHVFERKPTLGRKFMMAGRGGLNLTHSEPFEKFITRYGAAASWLRPALEQFTPTDLRHWCDSLGGETFVGSSGRVFPKALKASPLLRAWIARLGAQGVQFHLQHDWQGWTDKGELLINNQPFKADAVFLSLGGASWPRLGSDGSWADILRGKGIALTPFQPANSGFLVNWSEHFSSRFAGQPLKPVILKLGDQAVEGEIMLSRYGLEGGAIYALSSAIRETINAQGQAMLQLDLRPGVSEAELAKRLGARGSQSFSTWLKKAAGLSPAAVGLVHETLPAAERATISASALTKLIKAVPVTTTAPTGLERAISSAGGICRAEVDENFMLKKLPGVYALGEMLDWEAPTGGYLLQATFSTAVKAARSFA